MLVMAAIVLSLLLMIALVITNFAKQWMKTCFYISLFFSLSGSTFSFWNWSADKFELTKFLSQTIFANFEKAAKNSETHQPSSQLPLGNPSSKNKKNEILLENDFLVISYNCQSLIPNWVAWTVTKDDFGAIDRQNDFRPDARLPKNCQVVPSDYSRSGFDRGHLAPSADRTNSVEANSGTFLMSNMSPQTNELNAGPWEKLERFTRSLARRNQLTVVYAGGIANPPVQKINQRITIPQYFWKVIVVFKSNETPIKEISAENRIICVMMPNTLGIRNENWRTFKTNLKTIEEKSGLKFFQSLKVAPEIRTAIDRNEKNEKEEN